MRYEIIIVLIVVVGIASWIYNIVQNQKIQKGIRFCEKVENLLKAYQEIFGVKVGSITYKYETQVNHYIIAYDSQKPKSFFMQLELGIADALDEFDKIKNCEYDYVEEDWECIMEKRIQKSLKEGRGTVPAFQIFNGYKLKQKKV